jgi:hypothetical protein
MAEHETAARDGAEFDELFKPISGKMAEAKLTRAAVTKMAFAAAEQLSRLAQDPREAFAAIATHLRSQGLDPGQIPAATAAAPTTPAGPSPQLIERANAEIAAFASARAA